jgi:recombination DNA repair RAD52 pathway protein
VSKRTVVFDREEIGFPESALERELIAKYLSSKGFKMSDLKYLSGQEVRDLMEAACRYAALRLAEIEARSKFCRKIEAPG